MAKVPLLPFFFFRSLPRSLIHPLSVEKGGEREHHLPATLTIAERERIELQRKLIRRRAGPCTEGEKGGGGGDGGWQLVATLSPRSRAGISFRVHRFIEFPA